MKVNPIGHSSSPYKKQSADIICLKSLRYISLLLYDVTPVSQRKTQYLILEYLIISIQGVYHSTGLW